MADNKTKIVISAEDRASGAIKGITTQLQGLAAPVAGLSAAFAGLAGAVGGLSLAAFVKDAVAVGSKLNDLSIATGATVEQLSAMTDIAELADVGLDQVAIGLQKLSKNMVDAASGGKQSAAVFKALGVSIRDGAGNIRDSGEMMQSVAKAIAGLSSGTERAAAAQLAFGKSGAQLLPMMKDLAEAGELQSRWTTEQADLADRVGDNFTRLGQAYRHLGEEIGKTALPALRDFSEVMVEAASAPGSLAVGIRQMAQDGTLKEWAEGGALAVAALVDVLRAAAGGVEAVGKGIAAAAALLGARSPEQAKAIIAAFGKDFDRIWNQEQLVDKLKARFAQLPAEMAKAAASAGGTGFADLLDKENRKIAKSVDEFARLMERLNAKDAGLDASFWKDLATLHDAYDKGRIGIEAYRAAVEKLVTQQKFHQDALAASAKAEKEWADAANRAAEAGRRSLESLQEKARAAEEELATYGLTRSEIESTIIARLEEQRAVAAAADNEHALVEALDAEIEARRRLRDASRGLEAREASRKAIDEQAKAWENFSRDIEQSLTDALMRGFESGEGFGENFVKTLQNTLKTAALKIAVQMVVQPVMGSLGQSLGYTQGGAGGGGLGGMSNIFSPISNIATSSIGGSAFGAGMLSGVSESLLGASFVGPSASLAGNASIAAGASFGSFLPAIGIGLGLLSLFGGDLFGGKEKPPVAAWTQFPQGSKDWGIPLATPWGDLRFAGQHMGDTEAEVAKLRDAFAPIAQRDYAISSLLSSDENKRIEQAIAGYTTGEMEDYSEAAMRAHFEKRLDLVSDAIGGWVDEIADAFVGDLEGSYTAIATLLSVRGVEGAEELARAFIGTLESAAGEAIVQAQSGTFMDAYINNLNAGGTGGGLISSLSREGETAADTFARLVNDLVGVREAFDLMGRAALDFSLAAADMASSIIEAAGGAEAFKGKFSAYYAEFYTEQERLAKHTERTAAEFDKLGLTMPDSHAAFRDLVDGIDLTSAAGQELFASLLDLAPAFDIVADAAEEAARAQAEAARAQAEAAEEAAAKHAASMRDLSIQWAEASGRPDWAKEMRRQDVRASITDQDQLDLQNAVWRLQDMAAKRELEIQLMEAQGNDSGATAARRALEIEGTDEALRSLKQQIWAAQDARVAAEEAARMQAEAARMQAEAAEAARRAAEEQARAQQALRDGWQRVADSIWDTMRRLRGDILGPEQTFARAQSEFAIATAQARAGNQDAAGQLPTLAQAVVELGKSQASTAVEQALLTARTLASLDRTVKGLAQTFGLEVPAYAAGSSFIPRDTLALVHEGERIIPAADNRALMQALGGGDMAAELRALRAEVALLRQANSAENSAIANHARTAADVLDSSARGGRSLYTRTTA